ncbi:MAG: right-handed parallel beta-helix repeat-containing protein, partial [Myxococcales bacterium]|nr:right-handed parallel beta-helix repeat-containing protein [Myxococcales bacterium]
KAGPSKTFSLAPGATAVSAVFCAEDGGYVLVNLKDATVVDFALIVEGSGAAPVYHRANIPNTLLPERLSAGECARVSVRNAGNAWVSGEFSVAYDVDDNNPPESDFPDASNTGPSGPLAPSGTIFTSFHGQVIQNLDINGEIRVQHNNVKIRNVRVRSQGGAAIYNHNNTGLVIEDCELDGQGVNAEAAVQFHNYTMRRCNIHGYGEGPRVNGNVLLEDNYIHGFANFIAQGAHADGIQGTGGSNVTIRHNTVLIEPDGANGGIFFSTSTGSNILIENNLVGGGNWAIDVDTSRYTDVRIIDNHITTTIPYHEKGGYFGPIGPTAPGWIVSGNVWHDGPNAGNPI